MLSLNYFLFYVHLLMGLNVVLCDIEIVSRDEWGAREPKIQTVLLHPVSHVVIHHSDTPAACYSKEACNKAMKSMQNYHMDAREWADIAYNFGSGSDGRIYMGRGWSSQGAHTLGYNSKSIGICLIGDWTRIVPPENQLNAVKEIIENGVKEGIIKSDYKLIGHREVYATECPGGALWKEIQKWPNWVANPANTAR